MPDRLRERDHTYWVGAVVLLSLLPLYSRQWDHSGSGGLSNAVYLLSVALTTGIALILVVDLVVLRRALQSLARTPAVALYASWLLVGQALIIVVYNTLTWGDMMRAAGYVLSTAIGYLILPAALGRRGQDSWWRLLLIIGAVSGFLGVWSAVTGQLTFLGIRLAYSVPMPVLNMNAVSGPFHEANIYAFACTLGIVGALYRWDVRPSRGQRLFTGGLILLLLVAVLISWSRQMYLAVVLGALAWWLVGKRPVFIAWTSIVAVAAIPPVLALLESLSAARQVLQLNDAMSGRDILWAAAIAAIKERPWLGYGLPESALLNAVHSHGGWRIGLAMPAHNGFLDLGVRAGVPIVVFYVAVIISSIVALLRSAAPLPARRALLAAMVVCVISIIFLSYSLGGASYTSLVLTVVLGLGAMMPIYYPRASRAPATQATDHLPPAKGVVEETTV